MIRLFFAQKEKKKSSYEVLYSIVSVTYSRLTSPFFPIWTAKRRSGILIIKKKTALFDKRIYKVRYTMYFIHTVYMYKKYEK